MQVNALTSIAVLSLDVLSGLLSDVLRLDDLDGDLDLVSSLKQTKVDISTKVPLTVNMQLQQKTYINGGL